MDYFIDVSYNSINKYGEELCGDNVDIVNTDDGVIVVLADGLGSGVKANILSTLTSKIAATMLKEGAEIDETVDTIVSTLPVCSVRKIAYSTFTIIRIYFDGRVYLAEYDNPPVFLLRDEYINNIEKQKNLIGEKTVYESHFYMDNRDTLVVASDGVIHAGVGAVLNLGWQWDNVADYLKRRANKEKCAKNVSTELISVCKNLYEDKPGDDTTVVAIKLRKKEVIDIFTGPPEKPQNDKLVVDRLMSSEGKKIVCGGTAAKIVARELGEELYVNMEEINPDLPPTARIKGIDLVTEGVLTLNKTVKIIKDYWERGEDYRLGDDGAYKLSRILIEDSTHVNLWVGKAINPAHTDPDFPVFLSNKLNVVNELQRLLEDMGRAVKLTYI
jgi:hypothetical protein